MEYTTIKVPKSLMDYVDKKIVGKLGYRNRSEFVIEAIRRRIEEVEK